MGENRKRRLIDLGTEALANALLELAARDDMADDLYVVTGPIFQGASLKRIGGAVMVPAGLFRTVYDPKRQEAGTYIVDNTADARAVKVSLDELVKMVL